MVQTHNADTAIGHHRAGQRQPRQVVRCVAGIGGQSHIDVIGLVVRGTPVAHGLAGHQRAQCTADLRGGKAQVISGLRPHIDFQRGFVGLDAGVQVHQTGNADQPGCDLPRQAFEFLEVRPLQRKLHLLVAAHGVQQAGMRDSDARHLFEPLAQCGSDVVGAALARLAVHQPDVQARIHLALSVPGVDGGDGVIDFRKTAHDGIDLLSLGLGGFKR